MSVVKPKSGPRPLAQPQFEAGGQVATVILAGSGYVAGELLRLLTTHPVFSPVAVVSSSQGGEPVTVAFPHLAGHYPTLAFRELEGALATARRSESLAIFSAAPHGHSAALVARVLEDLEGDGMDRQVHVVDLSADFRFPSAEAYERVYRHPHAAPQRLEQFHCGVPELSAGLPRRHIAHPGCFTTAALLGSVPLLAAGVVEREVQVSAVTGSTGAGKTPTATTHHPERRSNLFSYAPLGHRHEPEMESLAEQAIGWRPRIAFAPHAGPFARGIYATLWLRLAPGASADAVADALHHAYDASPFVLLWAGPPEMQDVVGTNHCHLGWAVEGRTVVVFSTLDNLIKGAAGGAVQWMNRLFGLPDETGLVQAGLGWL